MKINETNIKKLQVIEFNTIKSDILPSLSYLCQCIIMIFDKTKYNTFSIIKKLISYLNIRYSNDENETNNIILVSSFNDIEKNEIDDSEINDIINYNFSRTSSIGSKNDQKIYINPPIKYIPISNITKYNILKLKNLIIEIYNSKIYLSSPIPIFSKNNKNIEIEIKRDIISPKRLIKPINDNTNEEVYNDFKIILLGDTTVGKTAFFKRFFLNEFTDSFITTIGLTELSKYVKIEYKVYKIQIWDTSGQKRLKIIPQKYYEKADGIILMYDITNSESFDNIINWTRDIRKNASENLIIYLIGNKVDLIDDRKINIEKGRKIASDERMKFIEVSCKWNLNISDIVYCLVYDMYLMEKEDEKINFLLNKKEANPKNSCCK